MTTDRAKQLLPVIQAYAQNKSVQYKEQNTDKWITILPPFTASWSDKYDYRIKPEPKYIPFTFEDRDMFKDRWIYSKEYGNLTKIIHIEDDSVRSVTIGTGDDFSYSELLNLYTFEDGTPCGKLVTI